MYEKLSDHPHGVILVGRDWKVKSDGGVLAFIIYGVRSTQRDTPQKLVVDDDEGAYVICTSSPLVGPCFIALQLSCIARLSLHKSPLDLGKVTHLQ